MVFMKEETKNSIDERLYNGSSNAVGHTKAPQRGTNPLVYATLGLILLTTPVSVRGLDYTISRISENDISQLNSPVKRAERPVIPYNTFPVPTGKPIRHEKRGQPQNEPGQPKQKSPTLDEKMDANRISVADYSGFKHQDELRYVLRHAERRGVEPELIMAIRMAENGKEYICGVLPNKAYNRDTGYIGKDGKFVKFENEKEKQYAWLAAILSNRQREYDALPMDKSDFVSFIKASYCPNGDPRDKNGLNKNWEDNVNRFYNKFIERRN